MVRKNSKILTVNGWNYRKIKGVTYKYPRINNTPPLLSDLLYSRFVLY